MIVYVVYEINHADFETGLDGSILFYNTYKNKRKAQKKAKELVNKAKEDDLYMDNDIQNKKNPFKRTNIVDFYHDDECQDYKVTSIGLEETKLVA